MPRDHSWRCGTYRYNKKIQEVVFAPSDMMGCYKSCIINPKGEWTKEFCFWVYGERFQFPMKHKNFGQFLRKLQNRGEETSVHTKIISKLIKNRILPV